MIALTLCVITASQHVESKVITINNQGNSTTLCCVDGSCPCSSLSFALEKLNNNTIINITSESVTLNTTTPKGSGNLNNITITGNGATIMCNNTGGMHCESCSDVIIEGITWDRCGDPNKKDAVAGVYFETVYNITIEKCAFQQSQVCALNLNQSSSHIFIKSTNFSSNVIKKKPPSDYGCSGLNIITNDANASITISDSRFVDNIGRYNTFGLFVQVKGNAETHLNLTIRKSAFLSNSGGAYVLIETAFVAPIILSELEFNDNTQQGFWFPTLGASHSDTSLILSNSSFTNNGDGGLVCSTHSKNLNNKFTIVVEYSNFTNNSASTVSSSAAAFHFNTYDNSVYAVCIQYCNFINNSNGTVSIFTTESRMSSHLVMINKVLVMDSQMKGSPTGGGAVSIVLNGLLNNTFIITNVHFSSNNYIGVSGGALYIKTANTFNNVSITNCLFQNNTAYGEGAALFIVDGNTGNSENHTFIAFQLNCSGNTGGDSVVYIAAGSTLTMIDVGKQSQFLNNTGSAIHLLSSTFTIGDRVILRGNSANKGGALYIEGEVKIKFESHSRRIQFINNSAAQYGGAIYIDLGVDCGRTLNTIYPKFQYQTIQFAKNSAGIAGNSVYFNVHQKCKIDGNYNSTDSILYVPYRFKYDEPCSKTIVSSPRSLMLYFAEDNGVQTGENIYLVKNNILGHRILFNGFVFNYFNYSAAPTQFDIQCYQNCKNDIQCNQNCESDIELDNKHVLVDNVSSLSLILSGKQVMPKGRNVTLKFTSTPETFNKIISVSVVVELVPCSPGYFYNRTSKRCDCYHHQDIVECLDNYNEMKRGYWFGTVKNTTTVSLCPNQYCEYGKHRKKTRPGYCIIPQELDDQCKPHRTGVACGDCSSGYTLTYDSPDCVNYHHCSPVMTTLVLVLTILYWIVIIVAVFGMMNFRCRISLGHVYGILYYYSIVDILLDNNPYVTGGVFQLVAILSSFAKLSPQLFGELCFVGGLSRIDQQFIHYSHAVAISFFLVIIILVARHRPKVAYYVSHCIIHVMCLLLLLAYTSLASTSMQLLKPLTFAGVDEVYVYLSPNYKYFRGRHALYGAVAALCGVVVVIGMPLLLLLQPFINPRVSFIKIMPILDQFQSCYKDKYRYFASFYLICRLVIFLIVFICDSNYYIMLYSLQIASVVIAMIHFWIQPYKDSFLNGLDGVILLTLVLVVSVNSFTFLSSPIPAVISVLVMFPLLICCITGIKKLVNYCMSRRRKLEFDFDELDSYDEERIIKKRNKVMSYER